MGILSKLTVLYVEDETRLRESLQKAIGGYFENFITAKDGAEGLKKFKKYNPDIVITDISMPICDGLDMSAQIKSVSPQTPIVVLSAFSEKERLLSAIDIKIDKYLIKPIDPDELIEKLKLIANNQLSINDIINIDNAYQFDKSRKILLRNKSPIELTKKELLFVSILVENRGHYVSHESIKENVWINKSVTPVAIRTFIKRIREKTQKDFIKNVSGLGYKIDFDDKISSQ